MMYGLYGDSGSWGVGNVMGWFAGGFMMIVFWAILIGLVVWAVREVSGKRSDTAHSDSQALAILKERYARGEIDKEEFETKKKDIIS